MKRSNPKRRRNGSPESRFLEDLRAITVKHSLQPFQGLSSRGETFALQDDDCFVVFNLVGMKDLRMRPMTSDEADTANENEDTNIYHKGLVPTMNGFYLDRIDIRPRRKSCYGRKLGWKAMKMLTQLADKHKISLALHYEIDSSDNPHGVQDLEGFYSRFGFKESWVGSDMDWYMMIYPNTYYELHHKSTNPKRRRNRKQSQSVNSDNGKNMINRKRNNPSKCNDKSFSVNTSKGACTWHQGVAKEVTSNEYEQSQLRVRYGSPKGYKGAFAPRKGKSIFKPKSKSPSKTKPPIYTVDVKSFNAQYESVYGTDKDMGLVIAMALYDMGTKKYVDFTLKDVYDVASMDYSEAKTFVISNVLSEWENNFNQSVNNVYQSDKYDQDQLEQSIQWGEKNIQSLINAYFDRVEKYSQNKTDIKQIKVIMKSDWTPLDINKPRASSTWKKAVTKASGYSGKGKKKFFQFGTVESNGNIHGGDWLDAKDVFLTDGDLVCVIYAPMNPAEGDYDILYAEHSDFFLLTRNPMHSIEPFSRAKGFKYVYLK